MIKGLNSDISINGLAYHVQTQDLGQSNPYILSQVFLDGAVVKVIKKPYAELLKEGFIHQQKDLQEALRKQHLEILDLMASSQRW